MTSYLVLLRGINVGGKNKVPMAALREAPHPEVDRVWPGDGVIFSQRLSAQRTKSRLGKIVDTQPYKSMTIRSWTTTTALHELLGATTRRER